MTDFDVVAVESSVVWMDTRIPFRYGIATLTRLPHLFLRVSIRPIVAGPTIHGIAAEGLLPKWFDKNPRTSGQQDLENMWASIGNAVENALAQRRFASAFDLWWSLYQGQKAWGKERDFPALLWHFGVTMVERAVLDALCRHAGKSISELLESGELSIDAAAVAPDVQSESLQAVLTARPLSSIHVRHTVGLSDPLTQSEVADTGDDGLPETLEEDIQAYGLRFFKIKVRGEPEADIDRLTKIAKLIGRLEVKDVKFSLDGNEQFHEGESFREFFDMVKRDERLATFFEGLLFVEQPFSRNVALDERLGRELKAWKDRPPIIIDESDGSIDDLPRAFSMGFAGSSYKNCKGVIKGILNAARVRQVASRGRPAIFSGEDLVNIGPVALLQDLTMMAKLGISHVERNGHHYIKGLSVFSRDLQRAMLKQHGDLYTQKGDFAALRIEDGRVAVHSLLRAPFGVVLIPEEAPYEPFLEASCPELEG